MKKLFVAAFIAMSVLSANAQRVMEKLDRGLVAVKSNDGVFLSWRILGEEYYDVEYNVYRDGSKINDYGTSSKHPIYPAGTSVADGTAMYKAENLGDGTMVEVYKGTESFQLYRIDTAIARIEVFKAKGGTGIQDINKGIASDANAPIYDLRGVQVTKGALQKGIYIQNGKKFVVK